MPEEPTPALSLEQPVRGFYFDPRLLSLSGFEALDTFRLGAWLPPPVHYLTGLNFETVTEGSSTFTLPATGWLLSPQGLISGAAMAILADGPLGCAVQTGLPEGVPYTTAEISLTLLSPVSVDSGVITGVAHRRHTGRTLLVSDATITDSSGRVVALGSTRCVALGKVDFPDGFADDLRANLPQLAEPEWPSPHPFERPVVGELIPQEVWDRKTGLEIMQGCVDGETRPPISYLLGVVPVHAEDGLTRWTMPASEWMCSPVQGRLYGGLTAYIAGTAIEAAFQTLMPPATAFATLDLKVFFLRPVVPDGRALSAEGRVTHRGRTIAIGTSEVHDADGKLVAMATGSAMILPGRPAAVARAIESGEVPAPE